MNTQTPYQQILYNITEEVLDAILSAFWADDRLALQQLEHDIRETLDRHLRTATPLTAAPVGILDPVDEVA